MNRHAVSVFVEGVGIGVTLSGIAVEASTGQFYGTVVITIGSVMVTLGSVIWKKLK